MGASQPNNHERFHSRYNFLYAQEDRNFGLIKIYRKREINFDYVMVFDRRYSSNQVTQIRQQIQNIRRSHTLQNDVSLLRIMNVQELAGKMCDGSALRIYLQYINITLKDEITFRRERRDSFSTDEIMYVIHTAFKAYKFLKKLNANHLTLRPDTIFMNPEDGMVRFNPIRVDSFPTEVQGCECMPQSKQVFFQKSQRQFLYQLKSLVLDLVEICPQDDYQFRKNYQLLASINRAKTLQQALACLWETDVESLKGGKRQETTQVSSSVGESRGKFGLIPFQMNKINHPDPFSKLR